MSKQEPEQEAPPPSQSDHDVLIEIRDLLKELLKSWLAWSYTR